MTALDKFHAHLDEHQQCSENPMGMCPIGNRLLKEAADEAGDAVIKHGFPKPGNTQPPKEPQR